MRTLALVVTALAAAAVLSGSASGGPGAGYAGPTTLPGSSGGTEPSLAIANDGVRYASWQSPGVFASSPDGVAYTNLGGPDANALGDVTNAVDAAGALYNAQICGPPTALHSCVYRSLDGGRSWPQQTPAADMNPGASDRPWIDVYPKQTAGTWNPDQTTVYLEYHTFSPDDLVYVTVSHDGGKTFSPPNVVSSDTNAIDGSGCNTVPSGVTVDQRTGAVYALWLSGNDVATNASTGCNYSQIGPFDKAWVSVSTDGGATWTSHLAWQGAFDATSRTGDNADKIFGSIAADAAGQVDVVLPVRHADDPVGFVLACESGQAPPGLPAVPAPPAAPAPPPAPTPTGGTPSPGTGLPQLPPLPAVPPLPGTVRTTAASGCSETPQRTDLELVASPDGGARWTPPLTLNRFAGSYFFPWTAAGTGGNLDVVYYRSDTLQPNDPSSKWGIGLSQVTGAVAVANGDAAGWQGDPAIDERLLDPNPVHVGGICTFGIFCTAVPNANRNLADSIAIALDPAGGANVAWTNDAKSTDASGNPVSEIDVACQNAGRSATGVLLHGCYGQSAPRPVPPPVSSPPAGGGGVKGAASTRHRSVRGHGVVHAHGRAGRGVFRIDLRRGPGRKLTYVDRSRHVAFRAIRFRVRYAAHAASFVGWGRLNRRRVHFVATAVDGGARKDRFRIAWGHAAARGGVLVRGSVVVR